MRTPNNYLGASPFRANYQHPYEMHPNPLSKLTTSPSLPKLKYRTNLFEFDVKPYDSAPKQNNNGIYLLNDPSLNTFNPYESTTNTFMRDIQEQPRKKVSNDSLRNQGTQTIRPQIDIVQKLSQENIDMTLQRSLNDPLMKDICQTISIHLPDYKDMAEKIDMVIHFLQLFLQNLDQSLKRPPSPPKINIIHPPSSSELKCVVAPLDIQKAKLVIHNMDTNSENLFDPESRLQSQNKSQQRELDEDQQQDESRIIHEHRDSGEIWPFSRLPSDKFEIAEDFRSKANDLNDEIRNIINQQRATANEEFKKQYNKY